MYAPLRVFGDSTFDDRHGLREDVRSPELNDAENSPFSDRCARSSNVGHAESRFLAPSATLDIRHLEAGGFGDGALTIAGRREHRTHHHSRGGYVQHIQAPSEKLRHVRS